MQETAEPHPSEPFHGVGTGVSRSEKAQRGLVGEAFAEGGQPSRTEQLQQRVEPRQRLRAPLHRAPAQPRRAPQRVARPEAVLVVQAIGMQQREPRQQARVEPVALGVLVVVVTQVRGALRRHEHDACSASPEPAGERHPGVACWLKDHDHLGTLRPLGQHRPEPLELPGPRAEAVSAPEEASAPVGEARLVGGPGRDIDPYPVLHTVRPFLHPAVPSIHAGHREGDAVPDIR